MLLVGGIGIVDLRLAGAFRSLRPAALTNVRWGNPHGSAKVAYQGKTWDVILAPVARMETRGLTEAMVAPGKKVKLVGYPRSDGTPEMRIERVIAGDKTVELR